MKKILLIIGIVLMLLLAGCSSKKSINISDLNNIKTCDSVELRGSIVNVNQEKKWISVKITNNGSLDMNMLVMNVLSNNRLRALINKSLAIGESRVETTNYKMLDNGSISLEVIPVIKYGNLNIPCMTKGILLYKKVTK